MNFYTAILGCSGFFSSLVLSSIMVLKEVGNMIAIFSINGILCSEIRDSLSSLLPGGASIRSMIIIKQAIR